MDLGFRGLDPVERPKFVKTLGVLGLPIDIFGLGLELGHYAQVCDGCLFWACPLISLDLGLSWGIRPKFVMDVCIGLAHEDFGLGFELQPRASSCG